MLKEELIDYYNRVAAERAAMRRRIQTELAAFGPGTVEYRLRTFDRATVRVLDELRTKIALKTERVA